MSYLVDKLLASAGLTPRLFGDHGLCIRIMLIGPAEAAALLATNTDNRPIRPGRVAYLARVMRAGHWVLTHQGIAFSDDGVALDCQHRLHAIIRAGVDVPMMVTEGLPRQVFDALDRHERRSMADSLRIPKSVVEVANLLLQIGSGETSPLPRDVDEVACQIIDTHSSLPNSKRPIVSAAPMRAAAVMLMNEMPAQADIVVERYAHIVHHKTERWTQTMHAFGRQVAQGSIGGSSILKRNDLFARGLIVLDPTRPPVSKLQVKDPAWASRRVRAAFGMLGTHEEKACWPTSESRTNTPKE